MKAAVTRLIVFSLLGLAWQSALAAGFSVDCEIRAVEKDRLGNTVSDDQESRIQIKADETGMLLGGNGSQSRYSTLKGDSTVAAYFMNNKPFKCKMRGPAGDLDISIDRTTGDICEVVNTKTDYIVRSQCKTPDSSFPF